MFWGWFHKHLIGYKVYFIVFSSQNSAHLWTYLFGWVLFPLPFVLFLKNWKVKVTQSCLTLCDPMDYSLPSSSIHGILQARVLEWVAISFSRGSSWPGDWTQVSCTAGRFFTNWVTREAPVLSTYHIQYSKNGFTVVKTRHTHTDTHTHTHILFFVFTTVKPFLLYCIW